MNWHNFTLGLLIGGALVCFIAAMSWTGNSISGRASIGLLALCALLVALAVGVGTA